MNCGGGVGIRTCYCDLHSRRWGPGGGTRFQWILAAAWALECSRPPPPNLLHRGDPEISMCVPCCTCVLACCALPMPGLAGPLGGVQGRYPSASHQPGPQVEPHSSPVCCLVTWALARPHSCMRAWTRAVL